MKTVTFRDREVAPHKAMVAPTLGERTVLTNSPWTYVALWLKRQGKRHASFYWEQAEEFHRASLGLPLRSAPLLLYYSFMNATKALLVAKNVNFHEHHGVRAHNMRKPTSKLALANEGVSIMSKGVLPALSQYYGEAETLQKHSIQELFFNMVFIHRTYCLTYTSQAEMFIPVRDCAYAMDGTTNTVRLLGYLTKNVNPKAAFRRLPASFIVDPARGQCAIKSKDAVPCANAAKPDAAELLALSDLNRRLRVDLHYINGSQTLWYIKGVVSGPRRLGRQPLTLVLAAMHRLSEICRYKPHELAAHLAGQKNWLLSEFIQMAPIQFIDEIASELTGKQFLTPNVRPAT